jgi:hypothetical protein
MEVIMTNYNRVVKEVLDAVKEEKLVVDGRVVYGANTERIEEVLYRYHLELRLMDTEHLQCIAGVQYLFENFRLRAEEAREILWAMEHTTPNKRMMREFMLKSPEEEDLYRFFDSGDFDDWLP